ncbi:hypothetical protein SASPL_116855 [Salvia splendens]|uniref:Beta-hexosaminidase n=1 Tax=Salvia splendens TaxID=180675 RepID=A0A8X8XZG5_SALSN|nr:hypothetical protein SASPL_116855 [Salvia splendens]
MNYPSSPNTKYLLLAAFLLFSQSVLTASRTIDPKHLRQLNHVGVDDSPTYIWPLPSQYTSGNQTLSVNPNLALFTSGNGGGSRIVSQAFERYKRIIFEHASLKLPTAGVDYDLSKLTILVRSDDEEANSIYGALHGLETLSQLCAFDYGTKTVKCTMLHGTFKISRDLNTAVFCLVDTSRHYLPIEIIKQVIESMSFAKLNVLQWHIIDEESFPLEVPSFPNLWKGAYTKWERYTIDDASEIVDFAKQRGINVMAEVDVPGHAESWGTGYPDLWPSSSCREPLDVSKNFTFDLISGILSDMKKIFPFGLFHLGGDEVNTGKKPSTAFLQVSTPRRWFITGWELVFVQRLWQKVFDAFTATKVSGILTVPWESVYFAEPLEVITDASQQKLVLGGEVCMWGETADASDVQQTIWPRAAAAAEQLWSAPESGSSRNSTTVLQRLEYFRCLLTRRGVPAAPGEEKANALTMKVANHTQREGAFFYTHYSYLLEASASEHYLTDVKFSGAYVEEEKRNVNRNSL